MVCAADRADADFYDGRALDQGYAFLEAVSAPVVVELTGFSAAFGAEERAGVGCGWGHCFIMRGFGSGGAQTVEIIILRLSFQLSL